jgi:hypothetical protein
MTKGLGPPKRRLVIHLTTSNLDVLRSCGVDTEHMELHQNIRQARLSAPSCQDRPVRKTHILWPHANGLMGRSQSALLPEEWRFVANRKPLVLRSTRQTVLEWSHRLAWPRTEPSQGLNTGSNPVGTTTLSFLRRPSEGQASHKEGAEDGCRSWRRLTVTECLSEGSKSSFP